MVHTSNLYDKLSPYFAGSLRWIFRIFWWTSGRKLCRYFFGLLRWIFCIFSYVSRCSTSLFYRAFHCEYSGYFTGLTNENVLHFFRRLMVNILDTLSGVSRTIISILPSVSRLIIEIFCPTTHSQLSRYFVRRFTVKYLFFPVVSRWVFLILCPAPHGQLSRFFSGLSHWIISLLFRVSHISYLDIMSAFLGEYSRYFIESLRVNYLDTFTSRWKFYMHFSARFTVNYPSILSGASRRILDILSGVKFALEQAMNGSRNIAVLFL